jgi:hypothetical protein
VDRGQLGGVGARRWRQEHRAGWGRDPAVPAADVPDADGDADDVAAGAASEADAAGAAKKPPSARRTAGCCTPARLHGVEQGGAQPGDGVELGGVACRSSDATA